MSKKTSSVVVIVLIAVAIIAGIVLVNRGDGPVMGLIISDKMIVNLDNYEKENSLQENGLYVVIEKEYNKYNEKFMVDIPAEKDLYANIHLVECSKGTKYTIKWITSGKTIKEETKELTTDRKGIVSYLLDGSKVKSGKYTLELSTSGKVIFNYIINVK